jgi:DNA polymerase IV (DinB-like DNA polymerase)
VGRNTGFSRERYRPLLPERVDLPDRVIMHVDLDYFYAQCEENKNPNARGKPVVVCVYSGRTADSGVVSTSNYVARKYGVRAGMPIIRAMKLLEQSGAIFIPMNRPHYERVSDAIMEILREHADAFEQVGIDEAYLEISATTDRKFDEAKNLAFTIKRHMLHEEHTTCSIGIAPNKLVAKIASDEKKPDGLTVVKPEEVRTFLADLPASRIPGVGRKVEETLGRMQVKTIAQLTAISPAVLVETFGKSIGSYLFHAAKGENDEPVKEREQPTQLSRIATLKKNTRDLAEMTPLLAELTDAVAAKLIERNMTCRSVAIIAILNDLSIHTRSKTLDYATANREAILNAAQELLNIFLDSMRAAIVRRMGVRVSSLSKPTGQTNISNFLQV